ncbi:MAG: hypothetical protein HFE30_02655 [Clostridiales bacterium]|nr:hypothetical protein [Clostridiales bacterium]
MSENSIITDTADISLLYPTDAAREHSLNRRCRDALSEYTAEQLELYRLIDVKNSPVGEFFTDDRDVLLYRQETFRDILAFPELSELLKGLIPLLEDIVELRRMSHENSASAESYLYSITEVELYTSIISMMKETLIPLKDKVSGRAFGNLAKAVDILTESEYYKNINRQLEDLTSRVREVKSVTIGVNLDSRLKAESAGVLSVNNDKFKSGQLIDRVLRLDFKQGDMTCIAPLVPFRRDQSENQQLALTYALSSALSEVYKSSIRSWKKVIRSYVLENTDFLIKLLPEIEFVTKAAETLTDLVSHGCPLCYPEIVAPNELKFSARGLCNPVVSMKLEGEVVPNDFTFDENGMIYILTGPNRGGKSVITCAVGIAFAMAGLGLPVCAESCKVSPADAIFTHFPQGSEDTIDKGRLGEECARLEGVLDLVTSHSLVLLDESFSSTGAYEGSVIAGEVICGFAAVGCRAIFSTHLHELASRTDELNARCAEAGGVRIDNLVAEVDGSKRSFKIVRKSPDGKSYAADIAGKYGLSFDKIREKIKGGRA